MTEVSFPRPTGRRGTAGRLTEEEAEARAGGSDTPGPSSLAPAAPVHPLPLSSPGNLALLASSPPQGGRLGLLQRPASHRWGASPSQGPAVAQGGLCCRTAPPTPAIRLWLVSSWYCPGALGAHEPQGTDGT